MVGGGGRREGRALDSAEVPKQQDQNIFSKLTKMASSLGAPQTAPRNCKAMVPMLDFINHRTAARARFRYDAQADVFSVAAERAYVKGEQVLISRMTLQKRPTNTTKETY